MNAASHITTSGGLMSAAFIENIREPGSRQRGVQPETFALPWAEPPKSPAALEETIAAAWELLLERWDAIRRDLSPVLPLMDISQVRSRWLLPLFQLLDFEPVYLRGDTVLDAEGRLRYRLSHRGWLRADAPRPELAAGPILHTVPPGQDLDSRPAGSARGPKARSPHDMVQAFLNASPDDLWAVLSNGILLRLLRDYHHTFTKGYVEFDLESIFETRNYGDFRALYRLCHASRFLPQGDGDEAILPLERFYKDSIATGIRVGEDLRGQVRQAIEILGNGFLDGELLRQLREDEALCQRYYAEILRIIYRILFLLFAEQRGMMPGRDSLYAETYSIARLRARAEGDIPGEDDFTDLWEGLKVTFRMVRQGVPALGIFGYDGMLFEDGGAGAQHAAPLLAGRSIGNSDLLRAVRALTLIEREGVLQRISYADLGVEELGSIYESLLDFTPRVSAHAPLSGSGRRFFLDPRGSERKTTGSYYTHPSLVNELIKSALLPVARERLAAAGLPVIEEAAIGEATAGLLSDYGRLSAEQRAAGEEALLSLRVCDPAAGSGHFLVKADDALGAELARIRSGDDYPTEDQVQAAKRDVLAHCLYAVDLNPMAVELCKVSLWINASVRDRPLSFLDHHIKCGNSLIGTTPDLMADGIPADAFALGLAGDDRETAKRFRKRNRQERREFEKSGALQMGLRVTVVETLADLERWSELTRLAEDDPQMARKRYLEYLTADDHRRRVLEADCWTAAFFWPMPKGTRWAPTFAEFQRLREQGPEALPAERLLAVEALAQQYRFFHWHLEFPEVFQPLGASESSRDSGGFDVVLGNPPWEMINLVEKEFFANKVPEIAKARTGAQRKRLIRELATSKPEIYDQYIQALRGAESLAHYLQHSGRFPLTSGGRINTYAVFAGLARQILTPQGRAGLVVPTGIATDFTYRDFFADLVGGGRLVSLYDFENRRGLFPEVAPVMKFSLLTLASGGAAEAEFAFFLHTADELADPERRFPLSKDDLALLNPNTRTVPVFRRRRDAELTRKLYRAASVLVNERRGEDPWDVSFRQGLFNMTSDSGLFCTRKQLAAQGYELVGNRFVDRDDVFLPLYEAKFLQQFDHRNGTFQGVQENAMFKARAGTKTPSTEEKGDPNFTILVSSQ